MSLDSDPSIAPQGDKEQSEAAERLIGLSVAKWLRTVRDQPRQLRRLATAAELHLVAEKLAKQLTTSLGDEAPLDLLEAVTLELKHQLREASDPKARSQHRIEAINRFLEDDLRGCVSIAIAKAAAAKMRQPNQIEELAHEASLEINQILLQAKKEFAELERGSEFNPTVQKAVMRKIHRLDAEYSVSSVLSHLEKALGFTFLSQLQRRLHRDEEALIARHRHGQLSPTDLQQAVNEQIKKAASLIDKAAKQVKQQFPLPAIQEQLIEELRQIQRQFTDPAALWTRLRQ